jgi:uncharacterized OsmC-like protein
MKISARVENSLDNHQAFVQTNDAVQSVAIPSKSGGYGSSVNGGELLFLALATCYCNDIYREAAKRDITVEAVEVEVNGEFGGVGEPATNVTYRVTVKAKATEDEIRSLMQFTDGVAEIQNTLRVETRVTLESAQAIAI